MSKNYNQPLPLTQTASSMMRMLPIRQNHISGSLFPSVCRVSAITTRERIASLIQEVLELVDELDIEDARVSDSDKNADCDLFPKKKAT
jgi:hypothetical protein